MFVLNDEEICIFSHALVVNCAPMKDGELTTFTDLENRLIEMGISVRALAINRTPLDNQYCIHWDGKLAELFYFERGIKFDLVTFEEKASAMKHFLAMVLADKSAYITPSPPSCS